MEDHRDPERSAQEEEAASNHLDWRCAHLHYGNGEVALRPGNIPHRHVPYQQATLDIDLDLLGHNPVRWTIEHAGPELRCRGIEVVQRERVERWVAAAGHPVRDDDAAAGVHRRL